MKKTKNCKNLRCILSLLLAVLMITSVIPMSLFGGAAGIVKAKAEGTTYKYASDYDGTSAITRVQWLTELTSLFEMSVENDSMLPDNYFSDLTEDSKSYKPMLLAAEFGLIDTEAGENVYPENPATREFAAHTLNLCLAFKLESDEYTFSDSASLTYPDDAQVAVNRGWFTLKDGAFCGDMSLSADEVLTMLNDAKALRAKETVDESADNMFSFADGVVVFENGTDVDYDESGNLIIADSKTELKVGDVFVVFFDGFPSILTAKAVEKTDTGYTVDAEAVEDGTPYIKEISAEGSANVPLDDFIPEDDVEIDYIATRRQARASSKASGNKINVKSMDFSKKIKVADGVTVTIKGNLDKMKFDYNIKSSNGAYFVKLNGNFNLNTTIAFNFGKMFGAPSSVVLGHVKIAGIGKVEVVLDVSATGKVVSDLNGKFCVGFSLEYGEFRFIHEFKKTRSTLTLDLDFDVSLSVTVSVSIASVVKCEAFAMIGMNGHYNMTKYSDGKTPAECKTTAGFMYMRIGAYAKLFSKRYENYITVFDERNSPVRIFFHYEDDVNVPKCTRNAQGHSKYYTPAGSVYGLPYSRNGSSKGVDRYGKPFTRYEYSLDDDGNATITKYNGNVSSIIIPEKLDGHTVVKIGNSVFENRTDLVSVMLPDTVTEIGYSAFENCKNLKTVILSNNLTTIKSSAFSGCVSLDGVVLPSSMLYIYGHAFYNCTSLTKINIPKNMVDQGDYGAFRYCSALKTVEFEAGITSISKLLFEACTGLESITIPDTVTEIGYAAFEDCKNLKTVILSNNLTTIKSSAFSGCISLDGVVLPSSMLYIYGHAFYNCTSLTKINIPKNMVDQGDYGAFRYCSALKTVEFEAGITSISKLLFEACTGLESITIPDTVTEIGYAAFEDCKNLKTVILSNNLTTIKSSAFSGCISLDGVVLPSSMLYIYGHAFYNCTSLTKINIPKNMVDQGDYGAFRYCSALKTVEFEAGITSISKLLFEACTGLESITIPDTVTEIGYAAFEDCKNLKTVILSNNLTTIKSSAFSGCSSLIDIIIPNGVTSIGQSVFDNCSSLKTIGIPDSVGAIDTGWFYGCTSLEKVKLSQKMPYIPRSTFSDCTALKDIVLPETITYIDDYAFKNCASLENINLPDRITQIRSSAFSGCVKLNNVNLPVKLEKICDYAFNNCDAFTKVEIPDGCKLIGEYAFANCDLLEAVTLSDSVTGIYSGAFMNCEKLKAINFGTGATVIASRTFKDCPSIEKVVIPKGIKTIYDEAFMNDINLTDITIPVSVTSISKSAFNYTDRTVIKGVKGSYAETFAKEMGFKFEDIAKPIEGICLKNNDTDTIYMLNGKTIKPEFEIEPVDNTDVLVFTSNNSCVRVNGNGTLYGNYNGSSVITVKAFGSDDELYSFTVNVRSVSSVTINTVPLKTDYKFGEALDTTGLTVSVKYSDGVIEQVTGFTVSGYDPEVYGEQTVRVSYEGRSATFKVNVIDDRVKLTGIEITALPAKTEYLKGEDFDPTGLKIVASYTDGTSKEINGYTLSKFNKLKLGTQTITVTYEGFTATFNVSVTKSECEHVYTEQVTTPATCSASGVKTFTCSLCGHFYTEPIPKTAHTEVVDEAVEPTCSAEGKTEGKHCSVCGEVIIVQNDIPKTAHTEVIDAAVPATCTSTGKTEGKHCSVCGEVIIAQNDIPKTAHAEVIDAAVPATCTSTGKTEGKHCSVCGEVIIAQNDIPKTAHAEVIDAAVPATCTSTGKTEGKHCSVCGEVIIVQTATEKIAHDFGEWQTKTAPTPSSEGTDVRKCAVCGFEETRTVAKLAPTEIKVDDQNNNIKNKDGFVTVVTSVTVTQIITSTGGNTQIHDKDGNEVKPGAKIATGMTVAIVSGGTVITQQTIVVMGDVDCDGDVQVGDARLALRAAVGLDTISGAVQAAASITHGLNEAVAVSDARYILRAAVALDKPEDWMKN